ncbi:hypothetical protein ABRQ22_06665 [Cellulosimicrobium sp. ES-005]|uniref:Holin n=1 Tax=Cellulosimicrobium sp. ES-005 TaxID=3163031 RepID=A0AAU8G548_9MICO
MTQETTTTPPVVPPTVRTVAYVVGIVAGLAAAPSLLAFDLPAWAAVAAAVSGAANALAFGYNPTRQ